MFECKKYQFLSLLILFAACILVFTAYSFASGMMWQFDDFNNLKGLSSVSSGEGFYSFVFSGEAGPLGRPVSLLSFVPDYEYWPNSPWGMARSNVVWHCLNGLLVFLFANKIFSLKNSKGVAMVMAALAALVWLVVPLHASTVLMPVQRMTLVSSFWMLAGLVCYAYLRVCWAGRESIVYGLVLAVLVCFFAGIAVFSKEMGILLLLYVSVTEIFIFRNLPVPGSRVLWRAGVVLGVASIPCLMAVYVAGNWGSLVVSYEFGRPFSLAERLATQVVVVWEYLLHVIFPRYTNFGPYHDDYPVFNWGQYLPWLSLIAWGTIAWVALRLAKQGWLRGVFAWGLFFYLSGHLVESTWVPLELYFEHRNYVPVVGVVLFFTALIFSFLKDRKVWLGVGFALIVLVNVFSLQRLASLWGEPLLAAEIWVMHHPDSARAAQTLAHEYMKNDFVPAGVSVLDRYSERHPGSVAVQLQALAAQCRLGEIESVGERFSKLENSIANTRDPKTAISGLSELTRLVVDGRCGPEAVHGLDAFLDVALQSPSIMLMPKLRHHYHYARSLVLESKGDVDGYLYWAKKAYFDFPAISLAEKIATVYFQRFQFDETLEWLAQAEEVLPERGARVWRERLKSMKKAVESVRAVTQASSDGV